jgi:hypothetical protein
MFDANDSSAPVGPVLVVDSVGAFQAARAESLTVVSAPLGIPGGFLASYQDPGGATIYVVDEASDSAVQ